MPNITTKTIREWYFLSGQLAATFADLRKSLQQYILGEMGEAIELDAGDGWKFAIQERQTKQYDLPVLREVFDQDALNLILVPDKKKVVEMQKTMKLSKEVINRLESTMEVVSTTMALTLKPPKR